MAISEVVMPQMGADMVEGTIVKWLKAEGDAVERGEIIAEIETDKANVEIEAFESGVFRKALAEEGDVIPVGGLIGIIAGADEDISQYVNGAAATAAAHAPKAPTGEAAPEIAKTGADEAPTPSEAAMETGAGAVAAQPAPTVAPATKASEPSSTVREAGRVRISPVARRMAEEAGLDVGGIAGTGPDGRIIKRDVEAAMRGGARPVTGMPQHAPTAPSSPTVVAPSKMRQAIARRMSQSKRETPHYYLLLDIDMTATLEMRAQYNAALTAGDIAGAAADTKVSINDMLVRAAALALRKHPEFNATIDAEGTVTRQPRQNVCIGIALDDGLIAPALLDAADKSLAEIAVESVDLVARAKASRMKPQELNDGTFTITNLGAFGVETLIGIIQPPQTAILGVGSVMEQAVAREGQVAVRQVMKVALSADHRATDGAEGAAFLTEIRRLLENPVLLVV
jgi:pyruvate dehydrogenase E2 component (dihydrolipoamide acetyltransferase)